MPPLALLTLLGGRRGVRGHAGGEDKGRKREFKAEVRTLPHTPTWGN